MAVKCTALFPHPPLAVEEIGGRELKKAAYTVEGFKKTAEEISQIDDLDLLVMITPHGPVFRSAASIIIKDSLKGDFSDFSYPQIKFEKKSDPYFAEKIFKNCKKEGLALQALKDNELQKYDIKNELDHGLMVPLYYLKKAGIDLPIIPISIGFISHDKLYKIGKKIKETAEKEDYNIAVIASGDLSHRLKKGAPAGYHPKAHLFDEKLLELLQKKEFKSVLNLDNDLIENAGECGLRPIVMMLGSIDSEQIEVELNSYEGPFGVGYANVFMKVKEKAVVK